MTSPKSLSRTPLSTVAATTIVSSQLAVQTPGAGFTDLTAEVANFVREAGAREGAVTLFIRHTSASLTIQENADPTVLVDLTTALNRLAPENAGWSHDTEGPDDMPAHIRAALTLTQVSIPIEHGRMMLLLRKSNISKTAVASSWNPGHFKDAAVTRQLCAFQGTQRRYQKLLNGKRRPPAIKHGRCICERLPRFRINYPKPYRISR